MEKREEREKRQETGEHNWEKEGKGIPACSQRKNQGSVQGQRFVASREDALELERTDMRDRNLATPFRIA